MNIAFQALVIFALVLPGILARYFYKTAVGARSPEVRPLSEEVAYGLVFACLIHAVVGPIAHWFHPVDLEALAVVLIGEYGKDTEYLEGTLSALTTKPFSILWYLVSTLLVAGVSGIGLQILVRKYRLDLRSSLLRSDNYWWYLLRGEIAEEGNRVLERDFDMVIAWCVTEIDGEAYLYGGPLEKSFFKSSGEPDVLVLRGAVRKKMADGREVHAINTDYVFLKFSNISNLAIKFTTV